MRHNQRTALVLLIVVTAGSLLGCSVRSRSGSGPSAAGSPAGVDATATDTVATTARPSATPTAVTFQQACTEQILLPFMKRKFEDPARELIISRVDIRRCRNGYAHVYAVTRENPRGHPQYEHEQLFLYFEGSQWQSVSEGTGISCSDHYLRPAQLLTACRALGYRS
jgi:hypothetical protein